MNCFGKFLFLVTACCFLNPAIDRASAQESSKKFSKSPVEAGFWSWPKVKPTGSAEIIKACSESMAVVFGDGRYIGMRFESAGPSRGKTASLTDHGRCYFKEAEQVEICEIAVMENGQVNRGVISQHYDTEADGSLRATVVGRSLEGPKEGQRLNFEIFPVKCDDDFVYENLLSIFPR